MIGSRASRGSVPPDEFGLILVDESHHVLAVTYRRILDHFAANLTGKVSCRTFVECVDALHRHRTIHYRGASSSFAHWARFEPGQATYDIWTLGLDARPTIAAPTEQLRVPSTVGG